MSQVPTAATWERSGSPRGVMFMQETSPFNFTWAFSVSLFSATSRHTRLPSPVASTTCTQQHTSNVTPSQLLQLVESPLPAQHLVISQGEATYNL